MGNFSGIRFRILEQNCVSFTALLGFRDFFFHVRQSHSEIHLLSSAETAAYGAKWKAIIRSTAFKVCWEHCSQHFPD